jgi:DNA-directed RNA polymerase beta subunit
MHYHVYSDEEKKIQSNGKEEIFCKPDPAYTKGIKAGNYDKLDPRGFAKIGTYVTSKDIIIGKKLPLKNKILNKHQLYKDCSTSLRMNEEGYVNRVYTDSNEEGFTHCKVEISDERIPSIGSKFASRMAQKGTIGMILNRDQMPFTKNGLVPDIIMTPHAIPSRMTIGQLMECLLGKVSSKLGGFTDCTIFNKLDVDKIGSILEENGFESNGDEILYSGITGKQMKVKIFIGPTYYQRLKHMVEDKLHCIREEGTEILTDSGWKTFAEIDITKDKLYTVDFYNGLKPTYQYPFEKYYYPNKTVQLYHIKNEKIDIIVTEEHRFPIIFYDQVSKDDFYFMTIKEIFVELSENSNKYNIRLIGKETDNDDGEINISLENITKLPIQKETTFCFSMLYETFYVRANGKEFWSGNSRSSGPVVQLTRQPVEGRSRDGGHRFGEMERDCMIGHGTVSFMKERLLDVSDKFPIHVCSSCGNYSIVNTDENINLYECKLCDNYNDFKRLEIPYATKLLTQELQGMGLNVSYNFSSKNKYN